MMKIFVEGGPYAIVLGLLSFVVVALSLKKAIDLFFRTDLEPERLGRGLHAILFWGCFSAVLGLLGQFSGIYRSLMVIREAGLVHPGMVAEGLAISSITTLLGLGILAMAGIAWFGLRSRLQSLTDHREGGISPGASSHAG
jgi:hypothetical protein